MRKWGCAVLAVVLAGCGQENAGGGGIEIPNGLGVTVTASGAARKGVKVRALARESWTTRLSSNRSVVVDSAYTDSLGQATLHCPSGEGCWVEALSGNQGARVEKNAGGGLVSLELASLSSLRGNLGSGPISNVEIHLGGSDRVVHTDASGSFHFDSLPQSAATWKWNLIARPNAGGRLALLAAVALTQDSLSVQGLADDTASVVLYDSSSHTTDWNLQGLFGHEYWWISTDGTASSVFGFTDAQSVVQSDGLRHYISLPANLSGVSNPWANTGLNLGSDTGLLPELSALVNFRLLVRGSGTWVFHAVERASSDSTRDWTASLPSLDTSSWTTVRIAASSFSCGSLNWASSHRVSEVVFQTNGGGKLEIAEVALEGASLSDWTK
jgi:hypothetical protein